MKEASEMMGKFKGMNGMGSSRICLKYGGMANMAGWAEAAWAGWKR
jgi:hypothetical protein